MNRRTFLTTGLITTAGAAAGLSFPAVLRAQSKDPIRIGFPLPLTGTFAAIAADLQKGAQLAEAELNAKGGIMGRKLEVLFRDDQLKPAVGAQRTKELIENDKVQFVVGGLAAHVQMAINEQTKASKVLYISVSQSDEISAKPDTSPLTFHEALNPTITSRAMAAYGMKNLGKKWWIVYADYAWGKQNNAVFTEAITKAGGTILGSTPYPLGKPEFSAHLPKIQAAKPEAIYAVTPGADNVPFLKQAISFGLKKEAKIAQPLHFLYYTKEGGAEVFQDIYGGHALLPRAGRLRPGGQALRRGVHQEVQPAARRVLRLRLQRHQGSRARRRARQVHQLGRGGGRAAEEPRVQPLQGQAVLAGLRQQVVPGPLDPQGPVAPAGEGRVGPLRGHLPAPRQRGARAHVRGEGAHGLS